MQLYVVPGIIKHGLVSATNRHFSSSFSRTLFHPCLFSPTSILGFDVQSKWIQMAVGLWTTAKKGIWRQSYEICEKAWFSERKFQNCVTKIFHIMSKWHGLSQYPFCYPTALTTIFCASLLIKNQCIEYPNN